MRRTLLPLLLAGVLTLGAACGGGDDTPAATGDTTTSTTSTTEADSASTTSSSTTTTPDGSTTTTAPPFNGSTTPTSAPAGPGQTDTALLTDVRTGTDDAVTRVVFEFEEGVPGFDVRYVDPPITADASGETVQVEGAAFLQVRMEPAAGVDLSSGDSPEETYTGPDRVPGSGGPVNEIVRTGDFEANLTWVVGLDDEIAFRVNTLDSPGRLVIELPSR